ncbi:hypothetical protein Q1B88_004819 [Salmonella enterica]
MATITVRNLPDEVHRAIRVRAAYNGRSTEAEIREILENIARPPERVKLGTLLSAIASDAGGLTDAEIDNLECIRDKTPAEPVRFD